MRRIKKSIKTIKSRSLKKKVSVSKLKRKLDALMSEYIRRRAADFRGNAKCVSCGVQKPWKELQCGHYVSRSHLSLRWDLRNCWPQCPACNIFKNGNYPNFTKYLLDNYGEEWLKELIRQGQKIKKWTAQDLGNEIEFAQDLISKL